MNFCHQATVKLKFVIQFERAVRQKSLSNTYLHIYEIRGWDPEYEGREDKAGEEVGQVDWEHCLVLGDQEASSEEHCLGGVMRNCEGFWQTGEQNVLNILYNHKATGWEGGKYDGVQPGVWILI